MGPLRRRVGRANPRPGWDHDRAGRASPGRYQARITRSTAACGWRAQDARFSQSRHREKRMSATTVEHPALAHLWIHESPRVDLIENEMFRIFAAGQGGWLTDTNGERYFDL